MSDTSRLPPAIFIMGPTASGKTDLAVQLVSDLPCEIISVDSALIYRGMNIGTAKPDAQTLRQAPHRLVDICDPSESYSAAQFRDDALAAMAEITAAGRIPLLVGGTMLYYKALQYGLSDLPQSNPEVRARLDEEMAQHGSAHLHLRLARLDPVAAQRIHPNDPQRIQRALEVYEISGQTLTDLCQAPADEAFPYDAIKLIVAPQDRSWLHQRIALRFELMLEQGLVAEVEGLRQRADLNLNLPSMRCVGYRQVWQYLDGDYDYATMVEKGIVATRQLAKRQMTWLRSHQDAHWLESQSPDLYLNLQRIVRDLLKNT